MSGTRIMPPRRTPAGPTPAPTGTPGAATEELVAGSRCSSADRDRRADHTDRPTRLVLDASPIDPKEGTLMTTTQTPAPESATDSTCVFRADLAPCSLVERLMDRVEPGGPAFATTATQPPLAMSWCGDSRGRLRYLP